MKSSSQKAEIFFANGVRVTSKRAEHKAMEQLMADVETSKRAEHVAIAQHTAFGHMELNSPYNGRRKFKSDYGSFKSFSLFRFSLLRFFLFLFSCVLKYQTPCDTHDYTACAEIPDIYKTTPELFYPLIFTRRHLPLITSNELLCMSYFIH